MKDVQKMDEFEIARKQFDARLASCELVGIDGEYCEITCPHYPYCKKKNW